MKNMISRILIEGQFSNSPIHSWKSVKEPELCVFITMDGTRGLTDWKKWPPVQQVRCPLGLTTQTLALFKNSCREKNKTQLFCQQITRPISFQESPIVCCQQCVFLGGPWVLGPQVLGNFCCRICDSVTVTVCQDSPH